MHRRDVVTMLVASALLGPVSLAAAQAPAGEKRTVMELFETFDMSDGHVRDLSRPAKFTVGSSDSSVKFHGLRWRHWGRSVATGSGKATTCDEISGCVTKRVRLVAKARTACVRFNLYTKVTATGIPLYGAGPMDLPAIEECQE